MNAQQPDKKAPSIPPGVLIICLILGVFSALVALEVIFYPCIAEAILGYSGNDWVISPGTGTRFLYVMFYGLPSTLFTLFLFPVAVMGFDKRTRGQGLYVTAALLMFFSGLIGFHLYQDFPASPLQRKLMYHHESFDDLASRLSQALAREDAGTVKEISVSLSGAYPAQAQALYEEIILKPRQLEFTLSEEFIFYALGKLNRSRAVELAKKYIEDPASSEKIKQTGFSVLISSEPAREDVLYMIDRVNKETDFHVVLDIKGWITQNFLSRFPAFKNIWQGHEAYLEEYRQNLIKAMTGYLNRTPPADPYFQKLLQDYISELKSLNVAF